MTLKEMKIPSPFSGYVVNEQASPLYDSKHTYDRINVSKHYVCGPCFMMKIQKTAYIENIGCIYEDVFDYILKEVREYGPGTVKGAIDGLMGKFLNLGNHLDPKKRFDSHENFLERAQDLMNVKAVKLKSS